MQTYCITIYPVVARFEKCTLEFWEEHLLRFLNTGFVTDCDL